jgi:uncharacterized protein YbjT (DUF2867 family)
MYLVTGVTGNVGREVVAHLLARGERVRVFTRDASKVTQWGERVETAVGDFSRPDTFARALDGVAGAYLMTSAPNPESFRGLMDAARRQPMPHIVFQSTTWASAPVMAELPGLRIGRWHKEIEDAIVASGARATFLRPSAFMTNCLQWAGTMRTEGVVYNPFGDGLAAPIAPEDIGEIAARALVDPSPANEAQELTGSELLTVGDQVEILARVLRKPIRRIDVPVEAAVQGMVRSGVPEPVATAVGESFEAVRAGRAAMRTGTVEMLTGHKPTTFETWARKNAPRFA